MTNDVRRMTNSESAGVNVSRAFFLALVDLVLKSHYNPY